MAFAWDFQSIKLSFFFKEQLAVCKIIIFLKNKKNVPYVLVVAVVLIMAGVHNFFIIQGWSILEGNEWCNKNFKL